jgi:hypothetical protein
MTDAIRQIGVSEVSPRAKVLIPKKNTCSGYPFDDIYYAGAK